MTKYRTSTNKNRLYHCIVFWLCAVENKQTGKKFHIVFSGRSPFYHPKHHKPVSFCIWIATIKWITHS